jgi:hypothetical protein
VYYWLLRRASEGGSESQKETLVGLGRGLTTTPVPPGHFSHSREQDSRLPLAAMIQDCAPPILRVVVELSQLRVLTLDRRSGRFSVSVISGYDT